MNPAIQQSAKDLFPRALRAVAVCAALFCANHVAHAAATNRPAAKGTADRYLVILDMSSAMERNAESTQRIVGQLMASGMVGQARAGDTIGIWTFNEELKTGDFPLQRWTPQTRQRIATTAVEFLGRHRYEKRSRFEKVIEPLTSVVEASERITVLIVTDGSERISGTPFDQEINESYRLNYAAQRKQRMPFITVLRAKDGEFIGWRVNSPPFRPEFPPFPVEPKLAETPEITPASKPESTPESKPEPKPEPQRPPVPSLIVVGDAPKPVAPTNSAETTQPPVTQTPIVRDQPPQPKTDIPPTAPVDTPVTQPAAGTETPTGVEKSEPAKPEPQPPPKSDTPQPAETKPAEPTAGTSTSGVLPAAEPDISAVPVQTAVAPPAESLFNRTTLLMAGAALLVVAFGLIYVVMRRVRPAEKGSLITRSMDHDQK